MHYDQQMNKISPQRSRTLFKKHSKFCVLDNLIDEESKSINRDELNSSNSKKKSSSFDHLTISDSIPGFKFVPSEKPISQSPALGVIKEDLQSINAS